MASSTYDPAPRHPDDSHTQLGEWLLRERIVQSVEPKTRNFIEYVAMKDKGSAQFFVGYTDDCPPEFRDIVFGDVSDAIVRETGGYNSLSDGEGRHKEAVFL